MTETITLQLPEPVARSAREIADHTHQSMEEVLITWLGQAAAEIPVTSLADHQVLALCDMEMEPDQQVELSQLLAQNRESAVSQEERERLNELMQLYRHGLVRKAEAWQEAVSRGLRPSPHN
jgi:hypothetical protein